MKRIIVILMCIFSSNLLFGQMMPDSFELLSRDRLKKVKGSTSATPISNSASDIVIVGDTIWLGTSRGLSQSNDNGETWINYYGHPDFGTESIPALAYDHQTKTIWAATMHLEDKGEPIGVIRVGTGYRYSKDGGNSWTTIAQPMDDPADSLIQYGSNQLYILPVVVPEQNITYDIGFTEGTIWVASWTSGLRKSTDMGQTWERIVLPPDSLSSISPKDILDFRINPTEQENHKGFSFLAINDMTLYFGSSGGLNKSVDGGISWQKFSHQNQANPISGNWVVGIEENLADNSIWAVTRKAKDPDEFYGISATFDYGNSWHTYLPGANGNNIGFRYYKDGNSYVRGDVIFCTEEGAYRTANSGETWILAPDIRDSENNLRISTNEFLNARAVNIPDNKAELWIGTNSGLARLTENYDMWDGKWKVYLASDELESVDKSFAFPNPFQPGVENTKIKYSTADTQGYVTIRIMDFGMNLVKTVIRNAYRGSRNDVIDEWDGRDENGNIVANGVYFYRLDIDSKNPIFSKIMVMR